MNEIITTYWTDEDHVFLSGVKTLGEMVPVAVGILERMKIARGTDIIQICGPMSTGGHNCLQTNMRLFKIAQNIAVLNGWHVFDQGPFGETMARLAPNYKNDAEGYCWHILHDFYDKVFATGLIAELSFLPKWETSKGTRWEREVAPLHRLRISDYPAEWLA